MKIIFFYPDKLTQNLFYKHENIIFCDRKNFFKYDKKSKKRLILPFKKFTSSNQNINLLLKEFRSWSPVWSRDTDRGDQIDLYQRYMLEKYFNFFNYLKNEKIKVAFFFIAIPHHLDGLLIDFVCRNLKIKQVFFESITSLLPYPKNYLIPFIQDKVFMNRFIIKNKISNNNFKDIINKWSIKVNESQIKRKHRIFHIDEYWFSKIFLISLFYCFAYYFYASIRQKIGLNSSKKIQSYSVITHMKQLFQQRNFLLYYKKKTKKKYFLKKRSLVIIANYQPEGTSFPMGKENNNHIDIIYRLRNLRYKDKIYYKEHHDTQHYFLKIIQNTRVGSARSKKYLEIIEKMNVEFLPINLNVNSSIFENSIPVTISGTIAIERSLKGLKTIVAGYPWYIQMPGIIHLNHIKSFNDFKKINIKKDDQIRLNTIKFLNEQLNFKSIINAPGLGMLEKKNDNRSIKEYYKGVKKLMKLFS